MMGCESLGPRRDLKQLGTDRSWASAIQIQGPTVLPEKPLHPPEDNFDAPTGAPLEPYTCKPAPELPKFRAVELCLAQTYLNLVLRCLSNANETLS